MMTELAPNEFIVSRGVKIPKSPILSAGRVRASLRNGTYESKEADAVLQIVRDGDRVLELGAGIGFMSTLIALKKQVTRITSYEANPALIPFIRQVHALNGVSTCRVRNALLAEQAGDPVPFYVRRNFLASSMDPTVQPNGIISTHQVPVQGVNDALTKLRPDVLVCDIEGAEASLLPTADLSGLRAAVLELHPQWIVQAGVQAVFEAFHRAGLAYCARGSQGKVVCFSKVWR